MMYRLGGDKAYAALERSETGKSNDLCSSLDSGSEVSIVQKLRLNVQVSYWCSLYTARRLLAGKATKARGHSPSPTVTPLCGVDVDVSYKERSPHVDKTISKQPLDSTRGDR